MNQWSDVWRLMRPKQWIKNVFVFVGILFAEKIGDIPLLAQVTLAAIAFCIASSSMYVFNDLMDIENDQKHPLKKNRPLASGKVTPEFAKALVCGLALAGIGLGFLVTMKIGLLISAYIGLNIAYSIKLKHIVLVDVFCIAAGFMLRIFVGTIGVEIPPSQWLLLCSLMLTLFLGFAKRRAEILQLGDNKMEHRQVLDHYGPVLLDEITAICATCVIISYSLYTMSSETIRIHQTSNLIYTVPFVIYGLFRYIYLLHHCQSGGDPTKDLFRDKHILASVAGWLFATLILLVNP